MKSNQCIHSSKKNSPFIDLTPIDDADTDGSYSKALSFAFENPRIRNIAITGPYGSGKSSIIKTYEKKSRDLKFLNISLASFKEEEEGNNPIDITLIERSILQQMLYGADSNKLPYSRFKRIATPSYPLIKALLFVLWPIILFFLYHHRTDLFNLEAFSLTWMVWVLLIDFSVSLPILLVSDFYKASFGLSLKKFSLKNAEIETVDAPEQSILNRHLDEIIYFFQVTNYNVVVIEDLDRFGNPEIFVKLREVNKLINDNEKTSGQIKFLYALKDDMFVHKNRAKFFDFIIPVVPVINSSNSLDKMLERLKKHDFAESVNQQFLREVSLYIDDLRLIHNIFNEFEIYYQRLKSESLDVTKLLAVMIYKNVYPNDFENLHHGKGALFEICKKRVEYIQSYKAQLKSEQEELRALIESADKEILNSIRNLINLYIGYMVSCNNTGNGVFGIVINNQHVGFSKTITLEQFTDLFSEKNIQLYTQQQSHYGHRLNINKSFSQIEEEINPGETFLSRKKNIENKSKAKKVELQRKIQRVEQEIAEIPQLQLYQLLQNNSLSFDELITDNKISNGELLKYLIMNGYVDETYHYYISNFHEGRLSKNDRDYLLTIRNFKKPDPDQRIDTPKEVCANMREEDFWNEYVLNVTLMDYLLETVKLNTKRIKSAVRYISENFKSTNEFFSAYFISGKHLDKLINNLSREWPEIAVVAIDSKQHEAEFISYIFRFIDGDYICENMNPNNQLTNYLSEQGHLVFSSDYQLPDDYSALKSLGVRFRDLQSLESNKNLVEFSHSESLYTITSENVAYVLQTFAGPEVIKTLSPERKNYTSIVEAGSEYLREYIEENLPDYIEKVFLILPGNSEESESAIKTLINNEIVEDDLKKKIISKQKHVFESFDGVPENLWSHTLLEEKVIISWKNISEYLTYKNCDNSVVTELLARETIVEMLSKVDISTKDLGEDGTQVLSEFVFHNNEISDSSYCRLVKCLPYDYNYFPEEISNEKIKCLINENIVILSEESFNVVSTNDQFTSGLISKNFNIYKDNQENYPISDDIRELLLSSTISNEDKIIVCLDVTPKGANESKRLSQLISNVLLNYEVDLSLVNDEVLSLAILNAKNTSCSIKLLIKCFPILNESMVMGIIAKLPEPYSEIASNGKRPKLDYTEENLEFANILKEKEYISSVKEKGSSIVINTYQVRNS